MRKRQIAALSLFAVGIGLTVFALWPEAKKEISSKGQISGVQVEKTLTPEPQNSFSPINTPIPTLMPSPSNLPAASLPTVSNPPSPTPVPARQELPVNLSINGSSSFSVTVDEGNNQCDVLTKALEQGKISSLNMQYNNTYGSYAVYQINGIGKENSVWWIYKVNGQSPTQGCSYIKANNGDNIEWTYIGSN